MLKAKVGECIELFGNVSFTNSIPLLEVFSFSLDYDSVTGAESQMNEETEEIYQDISSLSPRIDYDYMYT